MGIFHQFAVINTSHFKNSRTSNCPTRFKKEEGIAKWDSISKNFSAFDEKCQQMKGGTVNTLFNWHHTNISVFSGTSHKLGERRCQYIPTLQFRDSPTSSTGKLSEQVVCQSQADPQRLPHLKTQKLETITDWKMCWFWALKIQVKGFRIN